MIDIRAFRACLVLGLGLGLLATGATAAPSLSPEPPSSPPATTQRTVAEGIAIELDVTPIEGAARTDQSLHEGEAVRFRFHITDEATGAPLSGLFPAAWMDLTPKALVEGNTCKSKVEAFLGGGLLAAPELDLNVFYVLALNEDATISVVDPLFGFGTTKLLAMIFLPSPGDDWVLDKDQAFLYVSLPGSGQITIVDTATWKIADSIDTGGNPRRLALQDDGRYLWVAIDGDAGGVLALDTSTRRIAGRIDTVAGAHELALSNDDRHLFAANVQAGSVSIVETRSLAEVARIDVGGKPISIDYSATARAAYVSDETGAIIAIDGDRRSVIARIETDAGLGRLRFAPGERLAFVVNTLHDQVLIVDAAKNQIAQIADVEAAPDQIAFSDHLAYIRHQGSEIVLMIPLDEIGEAGRPVPVVDFTGGQRAFGSGGSLPSLGDSIVQAPGATAVLVGNPADRTIYYYKEGMAAPMGHFQNYGRQPRAVTVVDRSLRERKPGVYETVAQMRSAGDYDIAFFLDAPRAVHCFQATVAAAAPDPTSKTVRVVAMPVEDTTVGGSTHIRFRLLSAATGAARDDLADVHITTFRSPGRDRRSWPAQPIGDGVYEIVHLAMASGAHYAFVDSREGDLAINNGAFVTWIVRTPAASAETTAQLEGGQ